MKLKEIKGSIVWLWREVCGIIWSHYFSSCCDCLNENLSGRKTTLFDESMADPAAL